VLFGGNGNDRVDGGDGNDVLSGGDGNDDMLGQAGNDRVYGGNGVDAVFGGTRNDTLYGGDSDDRIEGGSGLDLMYGDLGADTFRFDDGHTGLGPAKRDRIVGFSRSEGDKLDLDPVDANLNVAGDQDFVFKGTAAFTGIGQIRIVASGADRIVQLNNDSDLQADLEIVLQGFGTSVLATDFSHL
jgi:Ca2+-binding RTX toxin-like protein